MDPLEKKLFDLYQARKREEERLVPDFDTVWSDPGPIKKEKPSYLFLKVAASVAFVVAFFFYRSQKPKIVKDQMVTLVTHQHLITESLMSGNEHSLYIWGWKAPTDQLLIDAQKSLKTKL